MKLPLSGVFLVLILLFAPLMTPTVQAQGKFGGRKIASSLKAGVNFVWLSEFDSQGIMFTNRYHHYVSDRLGLGLHAGLLSSARYDDVKNIYTIKNTYLVGGAEASFDILQNESVAFRIGAGPMARRRSELTTDEGVGGTQDGSLTHVRTTDIGANAFIENDFGILRNGVAGGRIEYMYYTQGTQVLSIGVHLGFQF
ncbi:hypothetical protein MKJ04_08755 [Pontibacter sp. E15-1]|uniref:hypothetical protein n=1 Tax=Pontibacter sp. E15-1 TaxID=2919918 RepID=UPI001F4F7577|nr:hypothetical protein [Pontibacter sp. E15-1]MCJ8164933.1 hypothetical protein [Pontibacter sp. E15-1]